MYTITRGDKAEYRCPKCDGALTQTDSELEFFKTKAVSYIDYHCRNCDRSCVVTEEFHAADNGIDDIGQMNPTNVKYTGAGFIRVTILVSRDIEYIFDKSSIVWMDSEE
jgi:hypothetical protein